MAWLALSDSWGRAIFLAFPFTLGLVVMLLIWIKDNIPNARDIAWFKAGGGSGRTVWAIRELPDPGVR